MGGSREIKSSSSRTTPFNARNGTKIRKFSVSVEAVEKANRDWNARAEQQGGRGKGARAQEYESDGLQKWGEWRRWVRK
jgi:hypothetical protein